MYKLIINLKTYRESSGDNAIKIAESVSSLNDYAASKRVQIILCPNITDIKEIIKEEINTYSQHIDNYDYGAHTGYIIPHMLKDIGVLGTLISHSEHILDINQIEKNIKAAKDVKLQTCVCVRDLKTAKEVSELNPDFIAIEPKELIGGDISITTANPHLIKDAKKIVGNIPLLIGAGVKTKEDVRLGIELGAVGVLVASGVAKARDPKKAIKELIDGF